MKNFNKILLFLILLFLIIPFSFASDNTTLNNDNIAINSDNNLLSVNNIYFNSSVTNDGDGSQTSPYKYLNSDRLSDNSVAYFADGEYNLDQSLSINNLTIIGQNSLNTIIKSSSFQILNQNTLTLNNVTLNDLTVYNKQNLTATNVIFENNEGSYKGSYSNVFGGAIYSNGGNTLIDSCTFKDNSATYGGAIYISNSNFEIINSNFLDNNAYKYGGAIASEGNSYLSIIDSSFTDCYTITNAGGAIYSKDSTLTVKKSNFTSCNATFGGAICDLSSSSNIESIIASQNTAKYQGGAIYKMYGLINITSSTFSSNNALSGGAVFIDNSSSVLIKSSQFNSNKATYEGGAIYTILNTQETVSGNTYKNNKAKTENDYYKSSNYNMFIGNGNYTQFKGNFTFNTTLPSKYDLRDYGWVTPVKNQKSSGNCWAFTSLAALESAILKASGITYDLSEENMKNVMAYYSDYGWKLTTNKGGYDDMGVGYLVSWLGPFEEDLETFSDYSVISPVINSSIHVQNLIYLTRTNYTDNDAIKEAIINYGAVAAGIYYSGSYMKSNSYYYSGTNGCNHAITIVGWDDDYSKYNFKSTPEGNGAWICKNSWGENWGNKGYFYVSYYDTRCIRLGEYDKSTYTIILNDTVHYDKNYQYDIIGITDYLITGKDTIWYENIFNSTENEFLMAFSTYFNATTNWTAQIFVNNALKLTQNGISNPGYYTFNLNEAIPLSAGDTFKIVIKISADKYASFPISERVRSNRILYSEGVSFFSFDGENWIDLYDYVADMSEYGHTYESQVACIKAFTSYKLDTDILLDIPEIVSPNKAFDITAIVTDLYGNLVKNGEVTFNLDSKNYTASVVNGKATISAILKSIGNYTINANYIANDLYSNTSVSSVINVDIFEANLTLKISDISYGEKLVIENTLISNGEKVSANITVLIDSKSYSIKSNNNTTIDAILNPGNYTATGSFSNIASTNTTFNVAKLPLSIEMDILKTDVNAVSITLELSQAINDVVKVDVNSKTYNVNVSNGKGVLNLSNLDYGNYTVDASYSSVIYENVSANGKFSVDYIKTHIDANDLEMYFKDGSRFYVSLLDKNNSSLSGQNITIRLNGVDNRRTTDANGSASIAVNLISGNYTVFVSYSGNVKYLNSNITKNISIKSTINSQNIVKYYRNDTQFYASILDFNGKTVANADVVMNINGVLYHRTTNSDGVVRLNINLAPDIYILTLTNPVTGEEKSFNITVLSRLVENNDLVKYYKNASKYSVKLLDERGDPLSGVNVTFNINGVFYNRLTDSTGVASLAINLAPGEYVITAQYETGMVSNKIKVLSIIESEDIEMTYKDGSKFNAKVLDGYGNPNPGINITFNINGVFYTRTTNSTGVASLNINLQAGKYIITSMYNGLSVSNTIVIRNA